MALGSLSSGLITGIGVGLASVAIASAALLVFFYYLRRRRKCRNKEDMEMQRSAAQNQSSEQPQTEQTAQPESQQQAVSLPLRLNGQDTSTELSDVSDVEISRVRTPRPTKSKAIFKGWFGRSDSSSHSNSFKTHRFTYKELRKATNGFKTLIGAGVSGSVYKGTLPSGECVAIKMLKQMSDHSNKEFQTEVRLLERLHHRNLVNLVGYCMDRRGHKLLIYEYMSNGSLSSLLHGSNQQLLTWAQRVAIAQDMAKGIEYLHKGATPPVIHRDIKSSNILLDSSMTARVCDFGLSKEALPGRAPSGVRGTCGYVDPEYVKSNVLTDKSDVYSFGVLLFELISGLKPQQGLVDFVMQAAVQAHRAGWLDLLDINLQGNCNVEHLNAMARIAIHCLNEDPSQRPSMRKVSLALSNLGQNKLPGA